MTRVVLVPGVLALLPEYAGLEDPVAELRAACVEAVSWLDGLVMVLADDQGSRVAEALLAASRVTARSLELATANTSYLVVGNGSACRTEKAPGHLDERAADFDATLGGALTGCDPAALAGLDQELARELWASTEAFPRLAELLTPEAEVTVDFEGDPYGVQYWVIRWEIPD